MRVTISTILALTLFSALASGQQKLDRIWDVPTAVLVAGIGMDIASSYGHLEANPLNRGKGGNFGGKAIAINSGVVVTVVAARLAGKRIPPKWQKVISVVNLSVGGLRMGMAIRNWRID